MNQQTASSSNVRYLVVLVTFLAAVLLYLHRFCLSYAQRYIKEDLGLTDDDLSICFSAFFFAYALGQVPAGWLSDRFGARRMLTTYILVWSLFTALMGMTMGFVMLVVLRMAVGLGQAGAYPTSAGLVSKWVPFSGRGGASSIIAFGGRVGGGVAPILTVTLVVSFASYDVPSTLSSEDWLDIHNLCFKTSQASKEDRADEGNGETTESQRRRADARVFSMLSNGGKESVGKLAASYENSLPTPKPDDYDPEVAAKLTAPPEDISSVTDDLNRIIQGDSLYRREDFTEIPLEKEARKLAARASTLSARERARLNRLLLEAVYPDAIRKIYVHGWRSVMFVYGSLGLIVAALFWICLRDRPAVHPWVTPAEVELIETGRPRESPHTHGPVRAVPMKRILTSASLWLMCINQWGGNIGWVFLVTWLPRYLLEEHSVPFIERGWMAAIPLWVGWAGMLLGGWLTDRVTGRLGLRWRTLPIALGRFLAMSAYLSCLFLPSAWAITAALAVVAFSNDLCNPSSWAYKQDVGGPYVGSIHGWANMWGNLGATISPILLQQVVSRYGWDGAFVTCAAAFLIAGIAALGVDARIPIAPPEKKVN